MKIIFILFSCQHLLSSIVSLNLSACKGFWVHSARHKPRVYMKLSLFGVKWTENFWPTKMVLNTSNATRSLEKN